MLLSFFCPQFIGLSFRSFLFFSIFLSLFFFLFCQSATISARLWQDPTPFVPRGQGGPFFSSHKYPLSSARAPQFSPDFLFLPNQRNRSSIPQVNVGFPPRTSSSSLGQEFNFHSCTSFLFSATYPNVCCAALSSEASDSASSRVRINSPLPLSQITIFRTSSLSLPLSKRNPPLFSWSCPHISFSSSPPSRSSSPLPRVSLFH